LHNNSGLRKLATNSYDAINNGYYDADEYHFENHTILSLRTAIRHCKHVPIISEIKFSSPSRGKIIDPEKVNLIQFASDLLNAGAIALSVLTQHYLFDGSIKNLALIRKSISAPLLMKDIIVSDVQIDAAKRIGADCILLITSIFDSGLAEGSIDKFIKYAEDKGLEVIIEVHTDVEFRETLKHYSPRILGINNRNLNDLKVDLNVTKNLLQNYDKGKNLIISESGISKPEQIRALLGYNVDAFLIGTAIMETNVPNKKLWELCHIN
jgi:indole-3-glycerol phosphate synthase